MSTPRVSIVIPTFNRARLLPRAIDSSLAQTLACEVVVCDHGSSDDTPAVAAAYGDRIVYVRREQDRGPIVCWRDGIEHARGECVHINYDDDWIEPDFVARTLPLLRPDVGFVYTRTRIHEPGNPVTKVLLRHPAGIGPRARIVQFLLREKLPISPGCALFRRSDLLKNLLSEIPGAGGAYGRNSGVGEDLLLFLLATLDYPRYAHVPAALAHFLAHPSSITTDAGSSGKMAALAEAYRVAKDYYLRQPGSIAPRRGLPARLAKMRWQLGGHLSR
jgi:glycosyltransferase involved in cell wall biosynthesis